MAGSSHSYCYYYNYYRYNPIAHALMTYQQILAQCLNVFSVFELLLRALQLAVFYYADS